jgi:hypothetical protein
MRPPLACLPRSWCRPAACGGVGACAARGSPLSLRLVLPPPLFLAAPLVPAAVPPVPSGKTLPSAPAFRYNPHSQ